MSDAIIARLQAVRRLIVTAHARPDGDALGSALALGMLLQARGCRAEVALRRAELGKVALLEGVEALVAPEEADSEAELMVVLDCATVERMPQALAARASKIPIINIDHHTTNSRFGELQWIDGRASSTGEMVWQLAQRAGWQLNRAIAEALWVAVITDTGRFSYESTSPATMQCGSDLLRYGVRTAWLAEELYSCDSWPLVQLRQAAYNSLERWCGGRVAVVSLPYTLFKATGTTKTDADEIIEIPRSLRGSEMALFLYETEEESATTRVSIRTRAPLDATELAQRFGGGGHIRAAGATLPGRLAEAKEMLRRLLEGELPATQAPGAPPAPGHAVRRV